MFFSPETAEVSPEFSAAEEFDLPNLEMGGLALEETTAADRPAKLSVAHRDFSPHRNEGRTPFDGPAFEGVVVDVLCLGLGREFAAVSGIVDDKVGIGSRLDDALAWVEVEDFGRIGAGHRNQLLEGEAATRDAIGVEEVDPIFDRGDSVRDLAEVVLPHRLLVFEVKGGMVSSHCIDQPTGQPVPENVLIRGMAKRGRHDVLGTLKVWLLGIGLIEEKVLNEGLDPDFDPPPSGGDGFVEGLLAAEVDDVGLGAGQGGEGHEVVHPLRLHLRRAAFVMGLRSGAPGRQQFLLHLGHQSFVLAVRRDDDPELFGQLEGLPEFGVTQAKGPFVGKEDFETPDTLLNDLAELIGRSGIEPGDSHVEGIITAGQPLGFRLPEGESLGWFHLVGWTDHLKNCGGSSNQSRLSACFVGIFRNGAHEGQVNVGMGVDEAGKDVLAGGIDDFGSVWGGDVLIDPSDGFVLTENIRGVAAVGVDDISVFNQEWHGKDDLGPRGADRSSPPLPWLGKVETFRPMITGWEKRSPKTGEDGFPGTMGELS